jgi:hypothetical protein
MCSGRPFTDSAAASFDELVVPQPLSPALPVDQPV